MLSTANRRDPNIELIWEYVRRAHFVHRPSQLTATLAWGTLKEAEQFRAAAGINDARIWELSADEGFVANVSLLNISALVLQTFQLAHAYWNGIEGPADARLLGGDNHRVRPVILCREGEGGSQDTGADARIACRTT